MPMQQNSTITSLMVQDSRGMASNTKGCLHSRLYNLYCLKPKVLLVDPCLAKALQRACKGLVAGTERMELKGRMWDTLPEEPHN